MEVCWMESMLNADAMKNYAKMDVKKMKMEVQQCGWEKGIGDEDKDGEMKCCCLIALLVGMFGWGTYFLVVCWFHWWWEIAGGG
ncbi:hypothetical protein LR48_Vigan01g259600 [Vigna angularis]|uniref:Transmembrane protein n=1 Tax=Phaseolus angularis TaxID=3914 RepID=A0A0L9TR76_PHAAN|nr:hypothetical protein LR48_Vigan01g259600 [Vigna angularis]